MKRTIKFIEHRWVGYLITLTLFAVFITGTVMRGGFNWGIDFVGGIKVIAHFNTSIRIAEIRHTLETSGIKGEVQQFGNEENNDFVIMTRLPERRAGDAQLQGVNRIENSLTAAYANNVRIIGREEVGPAIGDYLKKSAIYLVVWCILLMAVYLAFRFETLFSVGAMIMICHDVALSFLFCGFIGVEINIPIIAGVLTIFGYSINDTVIVYDRIRENMANMAKAVLPGDRQQVDKPGPHAHHPHHVDHAHGGLLPLHHRRSRSSTTSRCCSSSDSAAGFSRPSTSRCRSFSNGKGGPKKPDPCDRDAHTR